MDNVQDPAVTPQGQVTPAEQTPDVQVEQPQNTQTVDVPTEPSEPSNGNTDETSYESVAAKKGFKSPDDLAKAYVNSERLATKASVKAADLEKQFFPVRQDTPIPPQSPQFQPQAQNETQALLELDKFVEERVSKREATLRTEMKTELAKIELRSVVKENQDFANYASDIKELKSRYPDMSFQEAYTFSKALKGDSIQEARIAGVKEGSRAALKQSSAQVVPTKPVSEEKIPTADLIQGSSKRLTIRQGMSPEQINSIKAERAFIENQLMARAESEKDFLSFGK